MADLYRLTRSGRIVTRRGLLRAGVGVAAGAAVLGAPSTTFASFMQGGAASGRVTQWCYPLAAGGDQAVNEQMWVELADGFAAQYPEVEIAVEVLPWTDRNTKLTTALAAGAGPDVGYLNADFVPQHAGDGNLEPVDDVIADEVDDFLENSRNNLSLDGTLYAVPILGSVTTLLYNTSVLEQAGVTDYPTTWDELLAAGPAFKESGNYLTSYAGSLESTLNLSYFPLLWQAGGEVINAEGTAAAFNSPEGVDALNFVVTLFNEGFVDLDEGITNPPPDAGLLLEGRVGVMLNGANNDAIRLNDAWGEGVLQIGEPLTHAVQTSYGTTAGWGIFKGSENLDAAKAWVKYITSPEPMTTIVSSGGFIPPRASLGEIYADDPLLNQFTEYLPLMHGDVRHRDARAIISAVGPYIQAAILGDQTVEEALAAAE
ncbi:MAG: sugar ABC transporter substrate-binding protein, partial [Chloroflexota bacterium]|nr:sugar ABC transporter substrate-binding protein [Chloroflexota bacterium]